MPIRTNQPWRTGRARVLRAQATSAEDLLWSNLRDQRLPGFKFVRQAPIGPYFADFVCRKPRVIIEVDGATHGDDFELKRDAARTAFLETEGFRVLRVHNDEIYNNLAGVLESCLAFVRGEDDIGR